METVSTATSGMTVVSGASDEICGTSYTTTRDDDRNIDATMTP